MIVNSVALIAGAWWLQQQPLLTGLTGAAVLVPLAALAWWVGKRQSTSGQAVARVLVVVSCAVAGFFWAAAVAHWKLAESLPDPWQGRSIEVRGVVSEMTQPVQHGMRFQFDVEQVFTLGAEVPSRVSLVWYGSSNAAPVPDLLPGQRWRLTVRLRQPRGNANPHGFDFEAWMLERGLRATGYVDARAPQQLMTPLVVRPQYLLERMRESIRSKLAAMLGDRPYAGVIVALAIGDQRAIPPEQWQVFTRTGVNHLMSISGLHITMVASLAFLLVLRGWRRIPQLVLHLPALRAATVAGFLSAATYAALAGFAVPAQRTVYMLAVIALALWLGWVTRPVAVLALAAVTAVLLDPMAVVSPGFWLSFGAVAVIMLAAGGRIGRFNWLAAWVRTQWAITLALIPLLLAMFQQVSLVSPLANAFAIPLVSLAVVPLALLAAVLPIDGIAVCAHAVMGLCMALLERLNGLPIVTWQQHAPPPWAIPLALAGALWMLLPRGFPARWLGALLFLPLFLSFPPKPGHGELRLAVLDVGQGLAVVAQTRNHAILYDTGPAYAEQIDAGGRIIVPYLRGSGISRLDAMVVSHDDLDHSGGALSVLQAVPVGWVASALPAGHPVTASAPARPCVAGQSWEWDGVHFEMLHPQAGSYNGGEQRDNDRSCVLRITSPHGKVLLPADVERAGESSLLLNQRDKLPADILIAPHHGSRTSSSPEFLGAVAPRIAIFAVGHHNRFGHPHPAVVQRYRQAGAQLFRTDAAGAILIDMNPAGIQVRLWRQTERRYWRSH